MSTTFKKSFGGGGSKHSSSKSNGFSGVNKAASTKLTPGRSASAKPATTTTTTNSSSSVKATAPKIGPKATLGPSVKTPSTRSLASINSSRASSPVTLKPLKNTANNASSTTNTKLAAKDTTTSTKPASVTPTPEDSSTNHSEFLDNFSIKDDDLSSSNAAAKKTPVTRTVSNERIPRNKRRGTSPLRRKISAEGPTRSASDNEGSSIRTKNLAKNFRLSRNHSRVLSGRSPSPSRKLLAAEIAVAAAKREAAGPFVPEPPPLEQTPLLMMRFTNKATSKMVTLVEARLRKSGLIIYDKVEDTEEPYYTYLYLSAAQEALETFAEQVRWMKRTNDTKVVEYFTVPTRRKFISKKTKKRGVCAVHENHNKSTNKNCLGGDELFTSNEWCHLAFRLLDSVEIWLDSESSTELNLLLMLKDENFVPTAISNTPRRGKRPTLNRQNSSSRSMKKGSGGMPHRKAFRRQTSMGHLSSTEPLSPGGPLNNRRQNFHRQKSMMMQRVAQHGKRSSCLRHVLQANEFVDIVTPLHWGPARNAIVKDTLRPSQLMPPVQEIRNYYGEDVAFYFAWMGFLSNWLVVLGTLGAFMFFLRWFRNESLDEDEFTPLYGLFTFLWGVLFLRFWERHEHRLAYRWGTYSLSLYDKQKCLTTRPEFKGRLRISPVTGDYETYYPTHKRRIQYFVSALVTMVMLTVAFWMMIWSLNMQGYIHPERNPERWHPNNPHPFHYPSFAVLSEEGMLFDQSHPWRAFLPSIIHVAMIFTLNSLYRQIAEQLTEWENHETEASYRTSLIIKRFLFEAFDCYVALFYLAFYERDVDRLHKELVTVFNIDTFRRLAMECFIPICAQKISKWVNPHHNHQHHVSAADTELEEQQKREEEEEAAALAAEKKQEEEDAAAAAKSPASVGTASTASTSSSEPEFTLVSDNAHSHAPKKSTSNNSLKHSRTRNSSTSSFTNSSKRPSHMQDLPTGYKPPTLEELAEEADKDEYEAFDDYMEIVIQFGYVTLFASAYPLASLVALAANWVEIRSDCFKLARVCRRPRSFRADGIGVWKSLLSSIVWMSALTNCLIVGFTSDQMKEIFPNFYMVDKHGDTHLVHDKGWIAVFVIFGLERVLIILGLMIYAFVPEVPEDVEDEVERLHYVRALEHEEVLRQVMRKRSNKKKN